MDSPYILVFSFVVLLCAYCLELAINNISRKTIKRLDDYISKLESRIQGFGHSDED